MFFPIELCKLTESSSEQHPRKEVIIELKKEAEFFGDIVIVPFMDSYDLVVLKTVALCEYGVLTIICFALELICLL